jgi:hypothetical protein
MHTTTDYFGRPIEVGDTVRAMGLDYGLPAYATQGVLTVVAVNRTRVVTGSGFNGTLRPTARALEIVARDGAPMPADRTAHFAAVRGAL